MSKKWNAKKRKSNSKLLIMPFSQFIDNLR